ncbi:MAG: 7-carboxy-7-deazaguanine synthase QueE [Flavobacteriales bacterium]|jgi:organic radical activating enzyme|tara:strand:- start:1013 stop:1645 length:633 start_codon:yes stop_codon:yes gene_type:complete
MDKSQKELVANGLMLPLMEAFYTIQGEGYHSGKSAYFLRVGGCDVGCHWCDVKESWDANLHPPTHINDILEKVKDCPSKTVVITGGEPLMWNMEPITTLLHENGFEVHIETSGSHPYTGDFDWICLSPKKNIPPKDEIIGKANELKVIIYNNDDFNWAQKFAAISSKECKLFLQPEWSKSEQMLPVIIDYVMSHPKWNISLQTHKFMNIP